MNTLPLDNLQQLTLTGGTDRVLNNLITSDLTQIGTTHQWTAFCNVNGQVITTSWIRRLDSGFAVSCDASIVDLLINHIQHHALRKQFQIEISDTPYSHPSITSIERAIKDQYPIITLNNSEQFIPQMLGMMNHPGAVNLEKGCYLGQEIIMRAAQLGKVKRILQSGTINQPVKGCEILDTENKISGKVINKSNQAPYLFNMVTNTKIKNLVLDNMPITLVG